MHLGARQEDQRTVRTVMWPNGSETDLDALVFGSIGVAIFATSILLAVVLQGLPSDIAIGATVFSGLCVATILVPLYWFSAAHSSSRDWLRLTRPALNTEAR